jgi:hypothetical protein
MVELFMNIYGKFRLTDEQHEEWLKKPVCPSELEWLQRAPVFTGQEMDSVDTVSESLQAAAEMEDGVSPAFFSIHREGDEVEVLAVLWGAEEVADWHHELATDFRLAFRAGGEGVVFFHLPGYRATFETSSETGGEMREVEVGEDHARFRRGFSREISLINTWMRSKAEDPDLDREKFFAAEQNLQLGPLEDSPSQQAVLDALKEESPEEVWALARKRHIITTDNAGGLAEVVPDPEAMRAAIESGDKYLRVSGIVILADLHPDRSEDLVRSLLSDPSPHVREAASDALGLLVGSDWALDHFLSPPEPDIRVNSARAWSLGGFTHPKKIERLVDLLHNHRVFQPESYPGVFDVPDDAAVAAYHEACHYLNVIGHSGELSMVGEVGDFFMNPPVEALRRPAAEALGDLGGSPDETVREAHDAFVRGMGLALNQDDHRRKSLLGLDPDAADTGEVLEFSNLDVDRALNLVQEGFVNPLQVHGSSPPFAAFVEFLAQWPEVEGHGIAVSKARPDYRIELAGLSCDLSRVMPARKEPLTRAFRAMCHDAEELDIEPDRLYSRWD